MVPEVRITTTDCEFSFWSTASSVLLGTYKSMTEHIASAAAIVRKILSNPVGLSLMFTVLWAVIRSRGADQPMTADGRDVPRLNG